MGLLCTLGFIMYIGISLERTNVRSGVALYNI